jgi:hypothetical protein
LRIAQALGDGVVVAGAAAHPRDRPVDIDPVRVTERYPALSGGRAYRGDHASLAQHFQATPELLALAAGRLQPPGKQRGTGGRPS